MKGFTLIELLVVIAVIGVLAAGVLVAIDPLQKIKQANDVRAKSDMGQIVQALQSYSVSNLGKYPSGASLDPLIGELKKVPVPPTSDYSYTYSSADGSTALVYTTLQAPVAAKKFYCWDDTLTTFVEKAVPATLPTVKCP